MSTAAQASWRPSGTYTGVRDFIIKAYGIDPDSAEYLSPSPLRAAEIQNIPQAAAVIKDCIDKGMPVKIVGDYDADGITSTAILIKLFKFFGANVKAVIPRRFSDGYGIAERMVEDVTGSLIVTVDNGISGAEVIKKAKANGNTVVILDHHLAPEIMPEADAIVDPHIPGDRSSFREYCGAGLSLKLTEYMCMGQAPQQTFRLLLDTTVLAMIGTIADVVVLLGDNRRIVKAGLGIINDPKYFEMLSPGIRELLKLAGEPYDESSIAFTIAPILNAPGRLYDGGSSSSLKALLATDMNDALRFAAAMNSINGNRKELVAQWYKVAAEEAAAQADAGAGILVTYAENMPDGIAGIVAGRLAESFGRPAFVFARSSTHENLLKASGRSRGGFDLSTVLECIRSLTVTAGGHQGAAGITTTSEMFPKLKETLFECGKAVDLSESSTVAYDIEIAESQIADYLAEMKKYAPFGEGVREPVFVIKGFQAVPDRKQQLCMFMGANGQHVKLHGQYCDAVAFNMTDKYEQIGCPGRVDLLGSVGENHFQGNTSLQFRVADMRPATA